MEEEIKKEELARELEDGINQEQESGEETAPVLFGTQEANIDIRRPGIFDGLKTASTIKKQSLGIGMFAGLFLLLIAAYFGVLQPILERIAGEVQTLELELLDGETINENTRFIMTPLKSDKPGISRVLIKGADKSANVDNVRIMITPRVERSDIKNIYINNKVDEYKVVHHLGQGHFFVETAEFAMVDPEILSQFLVQTGYLLSMRRVAAKDIDDGNEILEDMEQFGFNDENAYFIVTKTDDSWYKIIIGDMIPTAGGYYVMYEDENGLREAIYIIDRTTYGTVLSNRYAILAPVICRPMNTITETIYIDNFRFYSGRELIVDIYNAEIPEDSNMLVNRQMRYPVLYDVAYEVSDNYNNILTAILSNLQGERVVHAFGIDDEEFDEEILEKHGMFDYSCRITFDFIDPNNPQNSRDYYLLFSQINEDGNYYVYSDDFRTIIEISADEVPFAVWDDVLKFIDRAIFMRNIDEVESITVKSPGQSDILFTLEGLGRDLIVKGGEAGGDLNIIDTQNFRQFYKVILTVDLWEYEEDTSYDAEPFCELIINMRKGDTHEYKFYFVPTATRRSFFTHNGGGQFYVMRDMVLKLMNDAVLALNDEPIDSDAPE